VPTTTGRIVVVQEGRFRLITDRGQARLFLLAADAPLEPEDLPPLQHRQAQVRVTYDDAPGLRAGLARQIDCLGTC